MLTRKQKMKAVMDYVENNEHSPLVLRKIKVAFNSTHYDSDVFVPKGVSLKVLVYNIIKATTTHGSYNKSGKLETRLARYRSSLDIWRHVISIRPEEDIFAVMRCIYQLRNKLYGRFCSTVLRTVFVTHNSFHGLLDDPKNFDTREYVGLRFSDWETIGLPTKVAKKATPKKVAKKKVKNV